MSATPDVSPDRHRWRFRAHRVTQLLVDLRSFRFQTWTLQASTEVRLAAPFTLRLADGTEYQIDPEEPERLAPVLTLLDRTLESLTATRAGELMLAFSDGSTLRCAAGPGRRAWEVQGGGALEGLAYRGGGAKAPWEE